MKLSEFILLSQAEKRHAVLHRGVLVAKRKQQNILIFLFRLEDYYVETWCNVTNHSVTEYRALTAVSTLEPYLNQISLQHLFK